MREELAKLMHEIWAKWMNHVFEMCVQGYVKDEQLPSYIIPDRSVERWKGQMATPYDELTEKEKDSDRRQADKILALIEE